MLKYKWKHVLILLMIFILICPSVSTIAAGGSYELNTKKLTLEVGNRFYLDIIASGGAEQLNIYSTELTSSEPEVAAVDSSGMITAVSPGSAVITVQYNSKKLTCKVTVKESRYHFMTKVVNMTTSKDSELILCDAVVKDDVFGYFDCYKADSHNYTTDLSVIQYMDDAARLCLKAKKSGSYILEYSATTYSEETGYQEYKDICMINVTVEGVEEERIAVAKGTTYTLTLGGCTNPTFTIKNTKIASVDESGKITAISKGKTEIETTVKLNNGEVMSFVTELEVTDPKVTFAKSVAYSGNYLKYELSGIRDYSVVSISSSDNDVLHIWEGYNEIYAYNAGSSVLTVNIDGKEITKKITVYNPQLTKENYVLSAGKTEKIKYTSIPKGAVPVKYVLGNKAVAEISEDGTITALKKGMSRLTIEFEDFTLYTVILIGDQKAVKAVNEAIKAVGTPYSQEKRMQSGYFDCSSLVWTAYKNAGLSLVSKTYAPTAADLAKNLNQQKKVIATEALPVSKLQPGDLIFYGGSNNGRYLNIYHVAIFTGCSAYYSWSGTVELNGKLVEAANSRLGVIESYYYESDDIVMIARPTK